MRLSLWGPFGLSLLLHLGLIGFSWPSFQMKSADFEPFEAELLVEQQFAAPKAAAKVAPKKLTQKALGKSVVAPKTLKKPDPLVVKAKQEKEAQAQAQREEQAKARAVSSLKHKLTDAGYKARLRRKIESKWKAPKMDRPYQLAFYCEIGPEGRIKTLTMKESSGFDILDQGAKKAIIASAPFAAPPKELLGENSAYQAWFRFRPEESP